MQPVVFGFDPRVALCAKTAEIRRPTNGCGAGGPYFKSNRTGINRDIPQLGTRLE
jgi:hypothetical protein